MSNEAYVTTNEVAERLRVHIMTVRHWIHKGTLPAIRYEGTRKWLIRESDVRKMEGG